jgi:beta-xylosidase
MHPATHPAQYDDTTGIVTWDGACTFDGTNSYATLSNGWKPYFNGHGPCTFAIDSNCAGAPASCGTRVGYGDTWQPAPNHSMPYHDDVGGRVTWDGNCYGITTSANQGRLSNDWTPTFTGACELAFGYSQCGGLYENPVVPVGCPDPGVIFDGQQYVMGCTGGSNYPLRTSPDLVHWTKVNDAFATLPSWSDGTHYWAPEIHKVGGKFILYFSSMDATARKMAIGAASAATATGPFTDRGSPLISQLPTLNYGLIDASEINAQDGKSYVIWKEDGNAAGVHTPIHSQELAADGLNLAPGCTQATLITNDQAWEGGVVEGPWMIYRSGAYYLFYSGGVYSNTTYAVGVAKCSSPTGPCTKYANNPILKTAGAWYGPGHCSVLDLADGETVMVYHAWRTSDHAGRFGMLDRIVWQADGWPTVPDAPSFPSNPIP